MGFVQIIRVRSARYADLEAAHERWLAATEGKRTVVREIVGKDRNDEGVYWLIVEFPDHESAMRNSALPETSDIAAAIAALSDEPPQFFDLDVIRRD